MPLNLNFRTERPLPPHHRGWLGDPSVYLVALTGPARCTEEGARRSGTTWQCQDHVQTGSCGSVITLSSPPGRLRRLGRVAWPEKGCMLSLPHVPLPFPSLASPVGLLCSLLCRLSGLPFIFRISPTQGSNPCLLVSPALAGNPRDGGYLQLYSKCHPLEGPLSQSL